MIIRYQPAGGESIYGAPFADEFHSRLRFNHRGLLACANAGTHVILMEARSLLPLTAAIGLIRRIQFLGRYVSGLNVPVVHVLV